jgi:GxxExxY protein
MIYEDLSRKIIGAFYSVYNPLGPGFLEKVYENAMMIQLQKEGLQVEQQKRTKVYYDSVVVGEYCADIVVDGVVILELKAADAISPEHEAQLLNYLKATRIELGFVFNFGDKPEFARRILTNNKKTIESIPDDSKPAMSEAVPSPNRTK